MPRALPGFDFDIDAALAAVVPVAARVPDGALTAAVLGTDRQGHGTVIDADGLIVTIGYLIAEADAVWVTGRDGRTVPAYVVGYDYETGFGLVRPTAPLDAGRLALGTSATLAIGEPVISSGHGGRSQAVRATVVGRREFAGYWEYVLDEAIFTAPAHPNWGGAALIGSDGRLQGVGSLLVQATDERGHSSGANMFVPIDLLKPILGDLCQLGGRRGPARPWLGIFVEEVNGCLAVSGVYTAGPAAQAGVEAGDIITAVGDERVAGLSELFRRIWALGEAGVEVPLTVVRGNSMHTIRVRSVDRALLMRTGSVH